MQDREHRDSRHRSTFDGYANSEAAKDATHPANQWARGLSIGGYSDWYVPAELELEILFRRFKPDNSEGNTPGFGANAYAVPPTTANYSGSIPGTTTVTAFQAGNAAGFRVHNLRQLDAGRGHHLWIQDWYLRATGAELQDLPAAGAGHPQGGSGALMPSWIPRIDTPRRVLEERTTAAVSAPSALDLTFLNLGVDGRFLSVSCSIAAWVTFYASVAARAADAARPITDDPPLSAGVLLDLKFDGSTTVLEPAPGSTYSNADAPVQQRVWARVRTELAVPHAATVGVLALVEYDTVPSGPGGA